MRSLDHNLAIVSLNGCVLVVLTMAKQIDYTSVACKKFIFQQTVIFETMLEKDGSVSVHNRNVQILTTEL